MAWQIEAVVLYSNIGEQRVIKFNTGSVNIITGWSYKGKSSIIDLIDYCLGSSSFKVSRLIRRSLSWVGLKLLLPDREVFLAREVSHEGNASTNAMLLMGASLDIPSVHDLRVTTNVDTIISELSTLLGISPNRSEAGDSFTRDSFTVNIRHACKFVYQPQDVLPSRTLLFPKQSDQFVRQSIVDTLPYFLGAVREDRLILEAQLAQSRRKLRQLRRALAETERLQGEGASRLLALVEEALSVGLITEVPTDQGDMLSALRTVLNWTPELPTGVPKERLAVLQDEFNSLAEQSSDIGERIRAAEEMAHEITGYGTEAEAQAKRLETLEIFGILPETSNRCPVCDQDVPGLPTVQAMQTTLEELRQGLAEIQEHRPHMRKYIDGLVKERDALDRRRSELHFAIDALLKQREEMRHLEILNEKRARVIGRLSLYLESYQEASDDSDLRASAQEAQREVERLEALLDQDQRERRLDSAVSLIGHTMTALGQHLEFEHRGKVLRFDPRRLMIHIDSDVGSETLSETGSAANYVSLHLAMSLALQKFFLQERRPVPHFLLIDQPSQAFYEPDPDVPGQRRLKKSEDRIAVEKIYDLLFSVVQETEGGLQIIVLDHADLGDNPLFQGAIIQRWRENEALIPPHWLTA